MIEESDAERWLYQGDERDTYGPALAARSSPSVASILSLDVGNLSWVPGTSSRPWHHGHCYWCVHHSPSSALHANWQSSDGKATFAFESSDARTRSSMKECQSGGATPAIALNVINLNYTWLTCAAAPAAESVQYACTLDLSSLAVLWCSLMYPFSQRSEIRKNLCSSYQE